ncbi:unnamed protein product [Lepidochelys olivacea]
MWLCTLPLSASTGPILCKHSRPMGAAEVVLADRSSTGRETPALHLQGCVGHFRGRRGAGAGREPVSVAAPLCRRRSRSTGRCSRIDPSVTTALRRSPFGPGILAPSAVSAHGAAAGVLLLGESLSPPPHLSLQLEQFSMGESPPGSFPLNHNAFPEDLGALNYHSAESLGFSASGSSFHEPHLLSRQNLSNCSRHGPIPNIVLTGDSPPGISKEIASALAGVPGFEVDTSLGLEEDLKIEPLTLDGLSMLSDPYALLTDPAVEDSFRTDRLQ